MSRSRLIYQSLGLFAGQNDAVTGIHTGVNSILQLNRAQSWDDTFTRKFEEVTQYGDLAFLEQIETTEPDVTAKTSWYVVDGLAESRCGLTVTTGTSNLVSCISGILNKTTDSRNYFLLVGNQGVDVDGGATFTSGVIGLGNGVITNYDVNVAVGSIPTASLDLQGLNIRAYASVNGTNDVPAVIPASGVPVTGLPFVIPTGATNAYAGQVNALRHGDVTLSWSGALGFSQTDLKPQSARITIPLARTPLQILGSRFAYSREINFPIVTTMTINTLVGDLADGNLADLICSTGLYDITLNIRQPACSGAGAGAIAYVFKGAKLQSETFSSAVKSNAATADFTFTAPIGSATQTNKGVFISGSFLVPA